MIPLITPEDKLKLAREIFQVAVWPLFALIAKRTIRALKSAVNTIITENVNRVRQELTEHLDKKLKDQDEHFDQRLKDQENMFAAIVLERRKALPPRGSD